MLIKTTLKQLSICPRSAWLRSVLSEYTEDSYAELKKSIVKGITRAFVSSTFARETYGISDPVPTHFSVVKNAYEYYFSCDPDFSIRSEKFCGFGYVVLVTNDTASLDYVTNNLASLGVFYDYQVNGLMRPAAIVSISKLSYNVHLIDAETFSDVQRMYERAEKLVSEFCAENVPRIPFEPVKYLNFYSENSVSGFSTKIGLPKWPCGYCTFRERCEQWLIVDNAMPNNVDGSDVI